MVRLTPPRIEQAWSVGIADTAYPQRLFNGEKMLPTRAPLIMRDSRVLGFIFTWFLSVRDPCVFSLKFYVIISLLNGESQFIQYLLSEACWTQARSTARGDSPTSLPWTELRAEECRREHDFAVKKTWFQFLLALLWDLGQFVWPLVPQSPCYGVGTTFPS